MLQNLYNYLVIITCNYNQYKGYMEIYCTMSCYAYCVWNFFTIKIQVQEKEKRQKSKNLNTNIKGHINILKLEKESLNNFNLSQELTIFKYPIMEEKHSMGK